MNFPSELRYTKDHEWVKLEGDTATVGITDFAQRELGDIVYLDITTVGEMVNKDDLFGTVEAVKTVSDLFMPVSGTVAEVNDALTGNPELVNSDPYGQGWMIRISGPSAEEFEALLTPEAYKELIGAS